MGGLLSRLRRSRRTVQLEQQAIGSATTSQVETKSSDGAAMTTKNIATDTATTCWKVTLDPPCVQVMRNNQGSYQKVTLKGVCYSPCPLNASNAYGPKVLGQFLKCNRMGSPMAT